MLLLATAAWFLARTGWMLAIGGVLFALYALFWDRPRGRRRCPKCWYDMAGVPGLVCPECGREAKGERQLFRMRQRRKLAVVVVLATALPAYVLIHVEEWRQHGWPALAPSSVLVLWRFQIEDHSFERVPAIRYLMTGFAQPRGRLSGELFRRYRDRSLRGWQQRLVARSDPQFGSDDWVGQLYARPRWPDDLPVSIWVYPSLYQGGHERKLVVTPLFGQRSAQKLEVQDAGGPDIRFAERVVLGAPAPGESLRIRLELFERGRDNRMVRLWSETMTLPTAVGGNAEEILEGFDEPTGFNLTLRLFPVDVIRDIDPEQRWYLVLRASRIPEDVTAGVRIEFYDGMDTAPVAWAKHLVCGSVNVRWHTTIDGNVDRLLDAARQSDSAWRVRIIGDANIALQDAKAKRYWSGEIEVPLPEVRQEVRFR